jgi:dTDP-4-dehydrorhamnose reductase
MRHRILVLGASGYVGSAFVKELETRKWPYYTIGKAQIDYTRFDQLWNHLTFYRPSFIISAAGYTGKPNVDACEVLKAETLLGNTLFGQTLADACYAANIPYGHVSSGCIYSGAKVSNKGLYGYERDLTSPEMKELVEIEAKESNYGLTPKRIFGFTEKDTPNFSFRSGHSSFYSGTKALAEESMLRYGNGYLWRLRIPFNEYDNPRNYLTKVQTYPKVYDNVNSISHLGDFVKACLDLWNMRAEYGIYNVVNEGWVTTRYVVEQIQKIRKPARTFAFWENDGEFYKNAIAPRSNCVLDIRKLLDSGVKMRSAREAIDESLKKWN